jgi:phospholipase/carboxylesterase
MSVTALQVTAIPPRTGQTPQGAIILLHGWGANAEDLAPLAPLLECPEYQFYFPNAPWPHPHVPGGRMWYDFQAPQAECERQLQHSRQLLLQWLQTLITETQIPWGQVILAGFSQGGAMTLEVGLDFPLAGLMIFSGYLHPFPFASQQALPPLPLGKTPPILIAHGQMDNVVPLQAAQQARDTLRAAGAAVEYQEFAMGHEIRPEVLLLAKSFVKSKLQLKP